MSGRAPGSDRAGHELVVVDLGLGNLRSVERAVQAASEGLGVQPEISTDPEVVARAKRLIVPGQGAFRDGAAALAKDGGAMAQAIAAQIERGTPYLGICLGLQLLLDGSDEAPDARGLGEIAGRVVRIENPTVTENGVTRRLKVPHMGWNQPSCLAGLAGDTLRTLLAGAGEAPWFYFVHSFHAVPLDPSVVAATASYGCLEITAALVRDNVVATQFHPEKSQQAGLALIRHWLARK
jgi:glutamine amidotransferase